MVAENQRTKRILIVDDEPDICEILKKVFEQSGFNADSYDDPILALENFNAGYYDLLLLDIKMPEIDGFHLYQEMKKIDDRVKVCFLTASEMYYERFRKEEEFAQMDNGHHHIFLRSNLPTVMVSYDS